MDLFTKHYPEEENIEASAYYYWYAFMQKIDDYGPKHPLWKDFGDISQPFWDWWIDRGEDLFMTGSKLGVMRLENDEEIATARAEGAVLLRVDTDCDRGYLLDVFKELLDECKVVNTPGRKKHQREVLFAKYPFHQRPNVDTLKKTLAVWDRRHPPAPHKRMKLYEIGLELKINPSCRPEPNDDADKKLEKREILTATVSRYERWARHIIKNVGLGVFPKMD